MYNREFLKRTDAKVIGFMRSIYFPVARLAIFIIFFWFGLLKVVATSPASPLVLSLLSKTMPFISPEKFLVGFGLFEIIIGIAFLIPHLERLAIALLAIHMATTIMPLFMLRALTWQSTFVPTLEGQYIIKNILIIALAIGIAAHLKPRKL